MKYDYVVIGSGISGIASAIILALHGLRVALIEKSDRIGPLIRGFNRKGLFFDTGFHHSGSIGRGEIGEIFFRYLGLSDSLKQVPCNPECFDIVRFTDTRFEFRFPTGYERISERLHATFPRDGKAIDPYLEAIKEQCASLPYLNLDAHFGTLEAIKNVHGLSLAEFLGRHTDNAILKEVLYIHCLLNGVSPDEQSLINYANIVGPYYESVNRIHGGGGAIIREFEKALAEAGVDVFCGDAVTEIIVSPAGILQGVRLQDSTVKEADGCISTIHPLQLLEIVPESLFRPAYVMRLRSLKETVSAFILYGETDPDLEFLSGSTVYLLPPRDGDYFNLDAPLEKRPFNISSSGSQTRDGSKRGFFAICPATLEETREWQDSFLGCRPEGYRIFKRDISERMVRHIESNCEELRGRIRPVDCSTPLTLRDYSNSPFGSMYGVKHKIEQYNPLPATRLAGLFLAGQAIVAPGLLGAIISGFVACGNIIGHEKLREELKKCS